MNKQSLKDIVAFIKNAVAIPEPPEGSMPSAKEKVPEPQAVPATPSTTAPQSNTSQEVKDMQSAMETLSTKIKSEPLPANMPTEITRSVNEIANQPKFSDGAWGPITDKSLHNIVDFADHLLSVPDDLKIPNTIYTAENLREFNSLLSGYNADKFPITGMTKEQENIKAKSIISHIEGIAKLYDYSVEHLSAITHINILNKNEQSAIQSGKATIQYNGNNIEIPLSSLTSINNFNAFLKSQNLDEKAKVEILNAIIDRPNTSRAI